MWNEVLEKMNAITPQLAARRWGGQQLCLVSTGVNLVYRFEKHQQRYYLRISHATLRSEAEILSAIHYQQHLFHAGVAVCQPILSDSGAWIESIWQEKELFLAQVCLEVPGKPMRFDHTTKRLYESWGETLGALHRAAQTYAPENHAYTSWQASLNELHDYAQHETSAVQRVLAEVTEFFQSREQSTLDYGLTHGDHRKGNVLSDGQSISIIDFDLPSFHWFSEDVFRPFFSTIMKDQHGWQDKWGLYLDGYLTIQTKESLDLDSFSKHLQLKALEIYLWTKYNWSGESAPGVSDSHQ